jgi:hypothetical protein
MTWQHIITNLVFKGVGGSQEVKFNTICITAIEIYLAQWPEAS